MASAQVLSKQPDLFWKIYLRQLLDRARRDCDAK
jgi:hypothetical protein